MTPYEIAILVSSICLTFFTFVLAVFTIYLYSEARKNRKYQIELNQPELSITFEPSERAINWINIKIKNIGRTPLYNLKLIKVKNDLKCFNDKKISDLNYLKKINYLRPEQEIKQFFVSFLDKDKKPEDFKFSIQFEYENSKREKLNKNFDFDFSQFLDMTQLGEEPVYKISKNIESMQKDIHKVSTGFSKLKVITQTKKEKQKEDREFINKIRKQSKNETKAK